MDKSELEKRFVEMIKQNERVIDYGGEITTVGDGRYFFVRIPMSDI